MPEIEGPPPWSLPDVSAITDDLNRQLRALGETVSGQIGTWLDDVEMQLRETVSETFQALGTVIERAKAVSPEIAEPLCRAGFWVVPSAPLGMWLAVKAMQDQGEATPQNVRQLVVTWYREDDCELLKAMVDGWSRNPYFVHRRDIIRDALQAHIDGKYTLSVPTLLPVAEGILLSITGKAAARSGGTRRMAEDVLAGMYTDFMREASKDAVVEFATGITLYGNVPPSYFSPERYPKWLEEHGLSGDQVLNRHAILHGVQTDYASEENSLRSFFLLDVLSWVERDERDSGHQMNGG